MYHMRLLCWRSFSRQRSFYPTQTCQSWPQCRLVERNKWIWGPFTPRLALVMGPTRYTPMILEQSDTQVVEDPETSRTAY